MKVKEEEKSPSFIYCVCATLFLFALSIFAIIAFFIFCNHLVDHFINNAPTIIFDRGGAFGFGGAIGAGGVGVAIFLVGVLGRPLTQTIQKIFAYGMMVGIPLMLLLPIISSIAISVYADSQGYISCDEAEKKNIWPIYRTNYYTKDDATCIELVEEVERDRPFL